MTLQIAPCSYDAAKYAVMNWHYSRAMPSGKLVRYGVWEEDRYIGAVLYGRGANNRLLSPYGLDAIEGCELVRVALRDHMAPVSRIVAATTKYLHEAQPGLRLVVSFADPAWQHHGGIYQAMNWIYAGRSKAQRALVVDGKPMHKRAASSLYGTAAPERITALTGMTAAWGPLTSKHVYLLALDRAMRRQILPLSLPYPHAVEGSEVSRDASSDQGQVRSLPTAPLGAGNG